MACDEAYEEQIHVFSIPVTANHNTNNQPRVIISTSSPDPVDTSLTIPGLEFERNTTITRSTTADISIPVDARIATAGLHNKTIIVRSSSDVNVHAFDNDYANGDGFLVLSTSQLGTEYRIPNYVIYSPTYHSFVTTTALGSEVSFFLMTNFGLEITIQLQPYESYSFEGTHPADLTGMHIKSDKPISVTSAVASSVPVGVGNQDGLLVQVPPVESWGHRFVLAPILGKSCGYIYRVISGNQKTNLNISNNGTVTLHMLQPTEIHEGDVVTSTMVSIQADHPVLVVKYLKGNKACGDKGDPSMIVVPHLELFYTSISFPVFQTTFTSTSLHYSISVIINCSDVDSLIYDNTISMSDWHSLRLEDEWMCCVQGTVTPGIHSVGNTNPSVKLLVSVYMLGESADISYAYQAGFGYSGE